VLVEVGVATEMATVALAPTELNSCSEKSYLIKLPIEACNCKFALCEWLRERERQRERTKVRESEREKGRERHVGSERQMLLRQQRA